MVNYNRKFILSLTKYHYMKVLIISPDSMDRKNLPLAFKKNFSKQTIFKIASDLSSAQRALADNAFDFILLSYLVGGRIGYSSAGRDVWKIAEVVRKEDCLSRKAKLVLLLEGPTSDMRENNKKYFDKIWEINQLYAVSRMHSPMVLRQISRNYRITRKYIA